MWIVFVTRCQSFSKKYFAKTEQDQHFTAFNKIGKKMKKASEIDRYGIKFGTVICKFTSKSVKNYSLNW